MLVLARAKDESIIIGDNIQITVIDIRNGKARLGIEAPPDVSIHRKEVFDAMQRENRQAGAQPNRRSPRPRSPANGDNGESGEPLVA